MYASQFRNFFKQGGISHKDLLVYEAFKMINFIELQRTLTKQVETTITPNLSPIMPSKEETRKYLQEIWSRHRSIANNNEGFQETY